jgi:hypothetical protein
LGSKRETVQGPGVRSEPRNGTFINPRTQQVKKPTQGISSEIKINLYFSRALLQNLVDTDLNNDSFPFSTTKLVKVAGHLCRAVRLSFVGEMGWELHIPIDSCKHVYRALAHEGKKHGKNPLTISCTTNK